MPAPRRLRVLIASHGHPAITRGGAEIAAYSLFSALQRDMGFEAWFLGCQPFTAGQRLGTTITQPFDDREFIYTPGNFDWFKFANRDSTFPAEFRRLLDAIKPDIVHFHHFALFGLEAFQAVKSALPDCKVVLTAHEYLLICNAYGQMVTKRDEHLCYRSTFHACHACFPDHSPADFFLRRHWAELFLQFVDTVVVPSQFLATRLNEWGVEANVLRVVENLIQVRNVPPSPPDISPGQPLRVGFFGQISRLKGIAVLLEAASVLDQDTPVSIEIHGEYRGQPPEFQAEFLALLDRVGSNVRYHGPYRPEQVDTLMQSVAIVVVPSIWWENSPVVIQEARRNKRPVICSGIGGMAEKVIDGVDGWHIPVGHATALATLLKSLAVNRGQIAQMYGTMRAPTPADHVLGEHKRLYEVLVDAPKLDKTELAAVV